MTLDLVISNSFLFLKAKNFQSITVRMTADIMFAR